MKLRHLLIVAAGVATFVGAATSASATTEWQHNHPARVEVNHRRGYLNGDIQNARRDDHLTRLQALRLHVQANQVRYQERVFSHHNGGHLTLAEQARLNQDENHIRTETAEGRVGHP
jgi:hypothetical protein